MTAARTAVGIGFCCFFLLYLVLSAVRSGCAQYQIKRKHQHSKLRTTHPRRARDIPNDSAPLQCQRRHFARHLQLMDSKLPKVSHKLANPGKSAGESG